MVEARDGFICRAVFEEGYLAVLRLRKQITFFKPATGLAIWSPQFPTERQQTNRYKIREPARYLELHPRRFVSNQALNVALSVP
jgi:hypothetical protein